MTSVYDSPFIEGGVCGGVAGGRELAVGGGTLSRFFAFPEIKEKWTLETKIQIKYQCDLNPEK